MQNYMGENINFKNIKTLQTFMPLAFVENTPSAPTRHFQYAHGILKKMTCSCFLLLVFAY